MAAPRVRVNSVSPGLLLTVNHFRPGAQARIGNKTPWLTVEV